MNAGLLKEKISIHTPHVVINEFGEETTEWKLKYTTRARVIHTGGGRETTEEIFYSQTREFQTRIYVPINDFDRISYDGKFYRILNIDKNKDTQSITIKTELVND